VTTEPSVWAHLWTDLERYVLVRTKHSGFAIFDTKRRAAIVLEDDDLQDEVVRRMLSAGSRVLDQFPH
jgi:hypothetical protein